MEDENNDTAVLPVLELDYLKELDLSKTPDLQNLNIKLIFSGKRLITTQLKLLKKKGIPIETTYTLLGLSVINAVYETKDSQPNYQTDDRNVSKAGEAKIISDELGSLIEKLPPVTRIKRFVSNLEKLLYEKIDQNNSTLPENATARLYNIFIEKKQKEADWPPKSIDFYKCIGEQIEEKLSEEENIEKYNAFIKKIENINREVFFLKIKKERGEISEEEYATRTMKQCIERDAITGKRFAEEENCLRETIKATIEKYQRKN